LLKKSAIKIFRNGHSNRTVIPEILIRIPIEFVTFKSQQRQKHIENVNEANDILWQVISKATNTRNKMLFTKFNSNERRR